jgi:ABC-type multidrug transport system ATPase subunit
MLAIMGPSGAGKTTLLRVLTLEAFGGTTTGTVNYDGHPVNSSLFKEKVGLVAQEDYHWTFLTCQETIQYAADFYLPTLSPEERKVEVETMLEKMGLVSCRNTIAGNQFIHGLSGGQKRRLSVAVALMKKLEMVFLDEPTSGLDAAAAAGIMIFLADVTKKEHLVTVFTVHQPSTNIFNSFDRVMLLSKGRIAYCGSQKGVPTYLQAISHPLPPQMNPAEFLLDIVNTDFTDEESVIKILDNWDNLGKPGHDDRIRTIVEKMDVGTAHAGTSVADVNFFSQLYLLTKRHGILSLRDPMVYTGRIAIFIACSIFFAIVYIHARVRNQEQALNRFWFIVWCCGVPTNMGVIAVYVFNTEFFAIKKEVKNGMVNTVAYLIANSIIQIPMVFVLGLAVLPIAAYAIINFQGAHFFHLWLIYSVTMFCWEGLAQLMSVSFANALFGMLQYVNMWFAAFLFCGIFLPVPDIVWPFRVFSYILPFRYTFQMLGYFEFIGTEFNGAVKCTFGPSDTNCLEGGFKCSDDVPVCYGATGKQVLASIHDRFAVINDRNFFGSYMGVLIAISVVCKLGYVVLMIMKTKVESKIVPTGSSSAKAEAIPENDAANEKKQDAVADA